MLNAIALQVLKALGSCRGAPFDVRIAEPFTSDPRADRLPVELAKFLEDLFSRGGGVLAGPLGGRSVYNVRREFDLFCKVNPLRVHAELIGASRLRGSHLRGVDIVVLRDTAEGAYPERGELVPTPEDGLVARHISQNSERCARRLMGIAVRAAAARRGQLAVVVKPGGLPALSDLWSKCAMEASDGTGVRCSILHADHAAYRLIQHPQELDVVVATNLFGDVLSDLGAVLLGSRGLSHGASFNADGGAYYQTNHGAAFDLVGSNLPNPAAHILALAMLLRESMGLCREALLVESALRAVWREGWRTPDLQQEGCKSAGTREFGDLVIEAIHRLAASSESG
jgi:3-isopropylmalate dehydrogenase